jgi:hypothetical protein
MRPILVVMLAFAASTTAAKQEGLELLDSLPESTPAWLADLLLPTGYRVENSLGEKLTLWFVEELPTKADGGEFNVEYGTLEPGGVVGLVRIDSPWGDYRKQTIPPGLYSLRYGIQPADGDHTGVTYFRDFLMMLPVADDKFESGSQAMEAIVEAAKASAETEHPGVMGLYQIYDPVAETQVMSNDWGELSLAYKVGDFILGVALEGHGQDLQI